MLDQKAQAATSRHQGNTAVQFAEPSLEFSQLDTRLHRQDFVEPPALATFRVLEAPHGLNPGKIEIVSGATTAILDSSRNKGVPEMIESAFQSIGDTLAQALAEKITGIKNFTLPQRAEPTPGVEAAIVDLTRNLLSTAGA